jgi:hypothetical protein
MYGNVVIVLDTFLIRVQSDKVKYVLIASKCE